VQHGAVRVQTDDVGVGQLGLAESGGGEVGDMDLELAGAGVERARGGAMATCADAAGGAHQGDLVGCLAGARPVQPRQQRRRIVGGEIGASRTFLAEDRAVLAEHALQLQARGIFVGHGDDIEVLDPVTPRRFRHHMPVVARLQENQARFAARHMHDPRAGRVGQRQPAQEMRAGHERRRLIVEKAQTRRAGGDQQAVVAACSQRGITVVDHLGQMLCVERGEGGTHGETR